MESGCGRDGCQHALIGEALWSLIAVSVPSVVNMHSLWSIIAVSVSSGSYQFSEWPHGQIEAAIRRGTWEGGGEGN